MIQGHLWLDEKNCQNFSGFWDYLGSLRSSKTAGKSNFLQFFHARLLRKVIIFGPDKPLPKLITFLLANTVWKTDIWQISSLVHFPSLATRFFTVSLHHMWFHFQKVTFDNLLRSTLSMTSSLYWIYWRRPKANLSVPKLGKFYLSISHLLFSLVFSKKWFLAWKHKKLFVKLFGQLHVHTDQWPRGRVPPLCGLRYVTRFFFGGQNVTAKLHFKKKVGNDFRNGPTRGTSSVKTMWQVRHVIFKSLISKA